VDRGPWTVDRGPWTVWTVWTVGKDRRPWTVDRGPWDNRGRSISPLDSHGTPWVQWVRAYGLKGREGARVLSANGDRE
jgi:hypothetical protein